MELKIYQPTEDGFLKAIDFNFTELKGELEVQLKKYQGLVYSEANIKEAKADKAKLNNFKKAIEARRIEIKKQCMAPYEVFETQVKELVAMIDQPVNEIDTQVKKYEQIVKDEKLAGIKDFYADRVGDLESLVPFDKIFDSRWLNATYKEADIHQEIMDLFIKVESDLKVISELQTEYELQIKDVYLKGFDLTAALQEKKRLEEQEAKLAEYKRQQEKKAAAEAIARQAAREEAEKIKPVTKPEPKQEPKEVFPQFDIIPPAEVFTLDFRVSGTREEIMAVKKFMADNGIKYCPVPKEERKGS